MVEQKRAVRRYHYYRLKKKRKDYYGWGDYEYVMTPKQLGKVANTPTPCSCYCCGNPRKHWNAKTRSEYINILNYIEQCNDEHVYARDGGVKIKGVWY